MRNWITYTLAGLFVVGLATYIVAQVPNSNYRVAGGQEWVIGGTLTFEKSDTSVTDFAAVEINFSAATTGTATITGALAAQEWYGAISWATADADPGKTTWAITTNTLTVTTTNAVTGRMTGLFAR